MAGMRKKRPRLLARGVFWPERCEGGASVRQIVAFGVLLLFCACVALVAGPAWSAERDPSSDKPSNSPAGRPTVTPAALPATTPGAVEEPGTMPAAEVPLQSAAVQGDWPIVLRDTFDDSQGDWDVGAVNFDIASLRRMVAGGAYSWKLDARRATLIWSEAAVDIPPEFYATVEARLVSGAATDISFGLAIRPPDVAGLRLFLLSLTDGAAVRHGIGESAETVHDWMPAAAIRPDDWNQLALKATASDVSFYVNGQQVIELAKDAVPPGRLSIVVWARRPGHYVAEFDDFEVRVAPGSAVPPATAPTSTAAVVSPPAVPMPAAWGRVLPVMPYTSPPNWPIVFWDEFVDNGNGWVTAEQFNRQIEASAVVEETFAWQFKAGEPSHSTVKVPHAAVSDFYAAVDVKRYSGPEDVWYGLTFRQADARHYYCFLVNDRQKYQVWARAGDALYQLVEPTRLETIVGGGPNRVGVVGEGETFTFFVNGQAIAALSVDLQDIRFAEGLLGLMLSAQAGDTGIIEFDNFELRLPEGP